MNNERSLEITIIQIIAKELAVAESAVVPKVRIFEYLAADSLDPVFLILALEEKFQIEMPDSEAASIQPVKDIRALVRAKYSPHHCRVKSNFMGFVCHNEPHIGGCGALVFEGIGLSRVFDKILQIGHALVA